MRTKKLLFFLVPLVMLMGCIGGLKLVGPPALLSIERTTERLSRGKYLANYVTVCIDCHSTRNWTLYSGPIIPGTEGKGGMHAGEELGIPGDVYVDNITPVALSKWTDGEIIRATVSGVGRKGEVLFPMMPYQSYKHLTKEDLYSIVVYLRSLRPIVNYVPDSEIKFPISLFMKSMPVVAEYTEDLDVNNELAYGKYLATIAGCGDCHTPMKGHKRNEKMAFAGGTEFPSQGGWVVRSSNLTPDKETGMDMDKESFIEIFKIYADPDYLNEPLRKDDWNTMMPWKMYAGMTEKDLGAIYTYLRSVKPINNYFELATQTNE